MRALRCSRLFELAIFVGCVRESSRLSTEPQDFRGSVWRATEEWTSADTPVSCRDTALDME